MLVLAVQNSRNSHKLKKGALGRALPARRWEVCRRVARQEGASRRRRPETQCWALGAL